MKRKLKIGIVGAGNIGGALTRHFTRLGHDVVVANSRGPESLAGLAKETGAKPVTVAEVPCGRDLVVVTIPEAKIPNLPPGLFNTERPNGVGASDSCSGRLGRRRLTGLRSPAARGTCNPEQWRPSALSPG